MPTSHSLDTVAVGDGVIDAVPELVGVNDGSTDARLHDAFTGGSTTPRNTVPVAAEAITVSVDDPVSYEYSVVADAPYSTK